MCNWVISCNPADWLATGSFVVATASLIVTTLYVIFTYKLLRATSRQADAASRAADLALRQAAADRHERVGPVLSSISELLDRIGRLKLYLYDVNSNRAKLRDELKSPLSQELQRAIDAAPRVSMAAHGMLASARGAVRALDELALEVAQDVRLDLDADVASTALLSPERQQELSGTVRTLVRGATFWLMPAEKKLQEELQSSQSDSSAGQDSGSAE